MGLRALFGQAPEVKTVSMYVLLKEDRKGNATFLEFAEELGELREKLAKHKGSKVTAWMAKHWVELSNDAIQLIRNHLSHTGRHFLFVDEGVQEAVVELLEFRRRFNNGKPLDLDASARGDGWDYSPNGVHCQHCQLLEEHHKLETVTCPGYEAWLPEQLRKRER